MTPIEIKIMAKIKKIRRERDIIQKEIATAVGLTQGNYSSLELGKRTLSFEMFITLARYLGINPGEILNEACEMREERENSLTVVQVGDKRASYGKGDWGQNRLIG